MKKFQSTHPRGVRLWAAISDCWNGNFNPRTHVGCDGLTAVAVVAECGNFNPRTHVGCDLTHLGEDLSQEISIHAPTWGATH